MQRSRYKILFGLLGLAGAPLLRADSAISSAAAVNHPSPDHSSESSKDVVTIAFAIPTSPTPRPLRAEEVMPSAMLFHDVPMGFIARLIGTRLGQKVEVETNAAQPISGDFGHMSLIQALNEAAAKAGLAVIDEGPEGLHLVSRESLLVKAKSGSVTVILPVATTPLGKSAADLAAEKRREAALKAADAKRIDLLKLRAKLLLAEPGQ